MTTRIIPRKVEIQQTQIALLNEMAHANELRLTEMLMTEMLMN